jgi:hypothetical protein
MSQQAYNPLAVFGFSSQQINTLRVRLAVPQFVYVSGPAGGGKTKIALLLAVHFFQAYKRPIKLEGQDLGTAQILQAAREQTVGVLFNDLASPHDYMRAGYCVDCRMIAVGVAIDGPSRADAAYAQLLSRLPAFAMRQDVTVIGVEREEADGVESWHIDMHTS